MVLLVQSLFHQLSLKECALCLKVEEEHVQESSFDGLFHSQTQSFLLMTEEVPGKNTVPSTGVLFRVANADFLIEEIGPADFTPLDDGNPFSEYVEASLDCLVNSADNSFGYNPLYMEARALSSKPKKTWRQSSRPSSMDVQKGSYAIWNDDTRYFVISE